MPLEKASAIVLRVVDFSETSSIVTLFTREFGKIGALAKGARRPKGPFDAALDLLCQCRIVFLRKSSDALDLLTEAKLERRFRCRSRNLSNLYAGYYVAELLSELTQEYDPQPELFDAAVKTLAELDGVGAPGAVLLRFEMEALHVVGHSPSLELCAECGCEVEVSGRVAFGLLEGGLLCGGCRPGKRHVISISGGAVRVWRHFADLESETWRRIDLHGQSLGELRRVMDQYMNHLLGRKPRLQPYLVLAEKRKNVR